MVLAALPLYPGPRASCFLMLQRFCHLDKLLIEEPNGSSFHQNKGCNYVSLPTG